jgi:hypothetical protein
MTAFAIAWDLMKSVPNLMSSDEAFRNRYQELMGKPYEEDYPPEGLFARPAITESNPNPEGHIFINLPKVAMGTSFNMIDDADEIEDMEGFEEMLNASRDVSHPLFEQRFSKDFIRNYLHELGHALTLDEVENWMGERYYRNPIAATKRRDFENAWESLAHILQDPHDTDWREDMRWHTGVGWG